MLVPLFRDCRLAELAIIATLAGIGEEMLFRGVIQAAAAQEIGGQRGVWLGLLLASVLFGLLHPITPTYAILAGLIGLYLGGLWLASGNLLTPVVAHGAYDFLALVYLVKVRRGKGQGSGVRDEGLGIWKRPATAIAGSCLAACGFANVCSNQATGIASNISQFRDPDDCSDYSDRVTQRNSDQLPTPGGRTNKWGPKL